VDTSPDSELTDLVERARRGDQDAWDALTTRFTNLLWSIARGMRLGEVDAADAVQTTWLRLVEQLDAVREPEHLAGWLAITVRRECLNLLRRGRRTLPLGDDDLFAAADDLTPAPDEALLLAERDAALWRGFARLTPRCQLLLRVLMADPPPTYEVVSAALGMRVGSIGPTRQRCLAHLRKLVAVVVGPDGGAHPAAAG
jgi:RNA polymerase sigma factor (sigma-70 family)